MSTTDSQLLHDYLAGSEAAFAEIIRRHIDFVYTVALRHTNGNTSLAEDVTQTVFIALARKTRALRERLVLGGCLYRTTQFAAIDAVRVEARRQAREKESLEMQTLSGSDPAASADPTQIRPLLDVAIGELKDLDRDAIVLRFFGGYSFAEIGTRLCVSEGAARMRVDRSLEKLRQLLERRGIRSTGVALATALAGQPIISAPAGLAATVATVAASAPAITGIAAMIGLTKLQLGAVAVAVAAGYFTLTQSRDAQLESTPQNKPVAVAATESPAAGQPSLVSAPAVQATATTPTSIASFRAEIATPVVPNSGDAPQIVLKDVLGPNNLYHDDLLGFSASIPEGWTLRDARRWGANNSENTAFFQAPWPSDAQPSMYYRGYTEKQAALQGLDAENHYREAAQRKEAERIGAGIADYSNVPESFAFTQVNGQPSLSYFATFTQGGEVMTEYFVRVFNQRGYVMFFTRGRLEDVKAIMPQVQQMAASVKLP